MTTTEELVRLTNSAQVSKNLAVAVEASLAQIYELDNGRDAILELAKACQDDSYAPPAEISSQLLANKLVLYVNHDGTLSIHSSVKHIVTASLRQLDEYVLELVSPIAT